MICAAYFSRAQHWECKLCNTEGINEDARKLPRHDETGAHLDNIAKTLNVDRGTLGEFKPCPVAGCLAQYVAQTLEFRAECSNSADSLQNDRTAVCGT